MKHLSACAALAASLLLASIPAFAQATHKPTRHPRRAAPAAAAPAGGINTPSTDFSKIERAPDDAPGGGGATGMRPVINNGNIGMGGAF